jgi:hypothetical protein
MKNRERGKCVWFCNDRVFQYLQSRVPSFSGPLEGQEIPEYSWI